MDFLKIEIDYEKLADFITTKLTEALKPFLDTKVKGDEIMGVQELAQYLGVTKDTIYKKVGLNEIPFFKIGDLTKFKKSRIDQWIESQTRQAVPNSKVFKKNG
jgi:excisionase family DNA binding protein